MGIFVSAQERPSVSTRPPGNPFSIIGEIKEVRMNKDDTSGFIIVELSMIFHFNNSSSKPLLIYIDEDYPWKGSETLARSREDALLRQFVYKSEGYLSYYWPYWDKIRSRLDQKTPPSDLIRKIGPGEEWSFNKKVYLSIEISGSFDKTRKLWKEIKKIDPLWLQVGFQIWPSVIEKNWRKPKFGLKLQKRWKKEGQLVIGHVLSAPIPFNLPVNQIEE